MKDKYILFAISCLLLSIIGLTAYNMFFTITVQDITGDGARYPNSTYFNFTIVNNMFFEKRLSYVWELDDSQAGKPLSDEYTGSGDVVLPARSSCRITTIVPPPRYITSSGNVNYFEGEGTHANIKIYDGSICVYQTS
jgi:hypothetical protein